MLLNNMKPWSTGFKNKCKTNIPYVIFNAFLSGKHKILFENDANVPAVVWYRTDMANVDQQKHV